MPMEEQILAEGCRKGDDTARRELYDRYAGRLLAICMRYSGDRATAEDLLHDAFLKIYGAFDRFTYRGPGSLRAWIERITVNVAPRMDTQPQPAGKRRPRRGQGRGGGRRARCIGDGEGPARGADAVRERAARRRPGRCLTSTASRSIPTGRSPGCWGSTRKAPLRSCSGPGPCWPASSGTIWIRIRKSL